MPTLHQTTFSEKEPCTDADPLVDERVISEAKLAELLGMHLQHARRQRRLDAEYGTPGHRLPQPIWISERRVGYRMRDIRTWLDTRPSSPPTV